LLRFQQRADRRLGAAAILAAGVRDHEQIIRFCIVTATWAATVVPLEQ